MTHFPFSDMDPDPRPVQASMPGVVLWVAITALLLVLCLGAAIVLVFYLLVGGRVYCSWVCPVNPITDAAEWLRCRLGIKGGARFSDQTRNGLLGAILLLAAVSGGLA